MSYHFSRRKFIQQTSGIAVFGLAGLPLLSAKKLPPLSFSTLGCPDWPFKQIVEFAQKNGYNGLEMRGILRQLDLPKCPEFSSNENISNTKKLMADHQLVFTDLGSSSEMHHADPVKRKQHLDDAKRFIDLAEALDCPNVRVFPNNLPKTDERAATMDRIISGLSELGAYASKSKVRVLMESHGDGVQVAELKKMMESVNHPQVGMIWDVFNMWSVTKEPPSLVYETLKKYIHHTHIKDAVFENGKEKYVLLGKGESPIFEAIDLLYNGGYPGYYSFEWEKMWHPDIEASDIALADYPLAMKKHFSA